MEKNNNKNLNKKALLFTAIFTITYIFFTITIIPIINSKTETNVFIYIVIFIPYLLLVFGYLVKSNAVLNITILSECIISLIYLLIFTIKPSLPLEQQKNSTYHGEEIITKSESND